MDIKVLKRLVILNLIITFFQSLANTYFIFDITPILLFIKLPNPRPNIR